MLYELIYHSLSDPDFDFAGIQEILEQSRVNNLVNDITGCLLHYQNEFVQILEGEKEDVLDLYKKISLDSRHSHILILAQGEIANRGFNEWSMAFQDFSNYQPGNNGSISIEELLNMFRNISHPTIAKKLFEVIAKDIHSGNLT